MDDLRKDSKPVMKHTAIRRLILSSSSELKQKIGPRRESNENEEELITNHMSCCYSSSSSKLQNPKKSSTPKHLMSPTISAASKVSTPRKKILMERNDSFSETPKTLNLESKPPNSSSQIPLSSKITDLSEPPNLESSQVTPFSLKMTDSEEPPYDPKTNILSPRPKFLRYNPNRRVEILKRREDVLKQQAEKFGSDEQESDDVSSSTQEDESGLSEEESNTKKGFFEHDESEVEIEEEEEEEEEVGKNGRGWSLCQVLKFLVLLGFVGFSTFYISVMNVTNPPLQSTVCDVEEGFKIFESGLEKSVLWNVSSNPGFVMKKASNIKEVELEKAGEIAVQIEDEILDDSDMIGMTQVSLESGGEDDKVLVAEEEVVEQENVKPGEVEIYNQEEENVESLGLSNQLFGTSELNEVVEDVVENIVEINDGKEEVVEEFEASNTVSDEVVAEEFEATNTVSDEVVAEEFESSKPISNEEVVGVFEANDVSTEDVAKEFEASNTVSNEDVAEESEASKLVSYEDVSEESEASIPVPNEVVEEAEASEPVAIVELGIVVPTIFVILASLIIAFRLMGRKQAVNESAPTMLPPSVPVLTEDQETIIAETLEKAKKTYLPKKDEVVEGRIEKAAESCMNSSVYSNGRVSEKLNRSRAAPTGHMLGEFTVEESGSSLRSCSVLKSKTVDSREDSKFSVSMSEKSRGRRGASSILQEDQTSLSEFSNGDSPSYGSFTTQEKITRKDRDDITTPVRRSRRIRTKSVTSP